MDTTVFDYATDKDFSKFAEVIKTSLKGKLSGTDEIKDYMKKINDLDSASSAYSDIAKTFSGEK